MILALWVPDTPDPHLRRNGLQFTIIVDFTGKAIQGMIRKYQFNDILSQSGNFIRIGINVGVGTYRSVARGNRFSVPVYLQCHFNAANPTGSEGLQIRRIA
jgi:hypothetical protein